MDRVFLIARRRRWTGKIVNFVDLAIDPQWFDNVVAAEPKPRTTDQISHVLHFTGQQVVNAQNGVALIK
jgi:hypothetical protein